MQRINLKITRGYRYFLYGSLALSWITGIGFWLIRRYGMVEGDFGLESSPWQYPMLQAHGFGAFLMLISLGAIFSAHIPPSWVSKRNRKFGITLITLVTFSLLSAYSLYYLVTEDWHEWLGNAHAMVGVLLPLVLFLHIYLARRKRKVNPINYA